MQSLSVWNPHHQSLIEKLEKAQKRATKLLINVKKLHYEERLRRLKIPTLKYRRIRGDMIELYKIFAGKYDNNTTEWITGKCIEKQHRPVRTPRITTRVIITRFNHSPHGLKTRLLCPRPVGGGD